MTLNRRSLIALTALAAWPAAALAETRRRTLREAFPYLREYWAIPAAQRSRFVAAYYVQLDGAPASTGVTAFIASGDIRMPLTISRLGRLGPLPTADAFGRDDMVEVTWPTGRRLSVNMRLEPSARPAADMAAPELAEAITQAGTGVRRVLGVMGMAAPRLTRVAAIGPASGEAVFAGGRRQPLPRLEGALSFSPAEMPGAVSLHFPTAPVRLQILSAP